MTIVELTALVAASAGLLTPIAAIVTAIAGVLMFLSQKKTREAIERSTAVSAANGAKLDIVKSQNDGMVSRLEAAAADSRLEAKTAVADASMARAETVAATAAGVAGVMEANRSHEASSAAIEKGARDAVEPIAEQAVAKGARDAVAEATREETSAGKRETG